MISMSDIEISPQNEVTVYVGGLPGRKGNKGDQGTQGIQGIPGDIAGPSSAVDGQLAVFDGVTGKAIRAGNKVTISQAADEDTIDHMVEVGNYLRLISAVSGSACYLAWNALLSTSKISGNKFIPIWNSGYGFLLQGGYSDRLTLKCRYWNGSSAEKTFDDDFVGILTAKYPGYIGIGAVTEPSVGLELPNSATSGEGLAYAWGTHSSRRWKTNISPLQSALDKISRLRGVEFDWKPENGGKHDIGLIAEDVGKVIPEVVTYEKNGIDATGLKYDRLVALLIAGMQEQQKRIEALERALSSKS
jgi:hypothetical protein